MKPMLWILLIVVADIMAFDTTYASCDRFLKRHVCDAGVSYSTARSDRLLDSVLGEFAALSKAEFASSSRNAQLAGLINLYNIATIKLITKYPAAASIKKIPSAWTEKWIVFRTAKVSLDQIEHEFIRKQFDEPRIHFALVCAAKSCPALKKGAFTPMDLETQLTEASRIFLTDPEKNSIDRKTLRLSAIFQWFGDDFKKQYGGYQRYVEQVLGLTGKYSVKFKDYNWELNSARCSE